MLAVRTVVSGLTMAESFFLLKEFSADLAQELEPFLSIVVVEIGMGCLAGRAAGMFRNTRRTGSVFYRG